ncbi:MAG: pantoate--beta-alanine ligase [Acidobacteriota bacterium]
MARPLAPGPPSVQVFETPEGVRRWSRAVRRQGRRLAFVPTMGCLHRGHVSLLRAAADVGAVAASVFVNPAQFGPGPDWKKYPRRLTTDIETCAALGVEAVYAPRENVVYAANHSTWVVEDDLARPLEGACRPGHFRGVLTVVLKLLHLFEPDVVFFGQKDAQQALLIRRMIRDLDLPVKLRILPTVREPDGLALSSRNTSLDPGQRRRATALWKALAACQSLLAAGEKEASRVRQSGLEILQAAKGVQLDYLEVVHLETLERVERVDGPVLVAGAIRIGSTRLIDNVVYPSGALVNPESKAKPS